MAKKQEPITGTEKEFLTRFRSLCYCRNSWQVWEDIIAAMACSIANSVEIRKDRREEREKEYARCIKNFGGVDVASELFAIVVTALDTNPNQDFLGKMYMNLELGSHYHGQYFTPASVANLMSRICLPIEQAKQEIEKKGWISLNDPACGGGVTLISAANTLRESGINYQRSCLFTGNDIDRVVAMMCYIQLSLLGCPGWIAIANTLSDPVCGPILFPYEKPGQEIWYTPMWFSDVWQMRIFAYQMDRLCGAGPANNKPAEKEHCFYCFDFSKEEPWKISEKRLLKS